jgi:hypothetical protein
MGLRDSSIATGMGARRQVFTYLRDGAFADAAPAVADVASGSGLMSMGQPVMAKGKIVKAYATPVTAANGATTTYDVSIQKIKQSLATPHATDARVPILASATALRIPASGVAGKEVVGTLFSDAKEVGLAAAGGASTITLASAASAVSGAYVGGAIKIIAGTGAGQSRTIITYSAARVATVDTAWATQPDTTSQYEITPDNTNVQPGDVFYVNNLDLTGANPGTDLMVGVVIEYDDNKP